MQFSQNNIILNNEDAMKVLQDKTIRQIGFSPMFFCEFFQGMEVLQMRGNESKEYIFGIYWSRRLVGHCYFGERYTVADLIKLVGTYMPPTIEELKEYDLKYGSDIWYCKFHPSQYAWIYDRVITPIEEK